MIFLKAIRVHQWTKNLLLFVPLITSHRFSGALFFRAATGFIAFCCVASSAYLLNDILDLEQDRAHPAKRNRPIAAGAMPTIHGNAFAAFLAIVGLTIALTLPRNFLYALALYATASVVYSLCLKRISMIDVVTLAGLYTVRVIAGAFAIEVVISPWLLAFSMFFFLSLAFVKRYVELRSLRLDNRDAAEGRGYVTNDLEQISALGTASGYISVLVMALYINGREVVALYRRPEVLWLVCPLLLYWIGRIWLLAGRNAVHDDPVIFAVKDRVSYLVGLAIAVVMAFAI